MRIRAGFTLGEIVTVIAVVLILSSIVVLVAGPQVAKSKTEPACESNLHQIAMAYNLYLGDNDDQLPLESLTENPRLTTEFSKIDKCPLTNTGYWDNVQEFLVDESSLVNQNTFPNGKPIPYFDQNRDVLYRCLDHGFGGYSRGTAPGEGRYRPAEVRGTVLGVRLNGAVAKVAPDSCWEFRYYPPVFMNLPSLWQQCDRS